MNLPGGYTLGDVETYIQAHNHGAKLTRKQVSSALSKLRQAGTIRIMKERTGNTAAEYECVIRDTEKKGA